MAKGKTPRQELEAVLDPDHAQAVIEHRKAKRAPLTAHAADLLAREFKKCADPNAAADEMILHGWQGFKAEWIKPVTKPVTYEHYREPKKDDRPEPSPEERARMLQKWNRLKANVVAGVSMHKPHRLQ